MLSRFLVMVLNGKAEQNGCRQRLEGYLSCQQHLVLAVA